MAPDTIRLLYDPLRLQTSDQDTHIDSWVNVADRVLQGMFVDLGPAPAGTVRERAGFDRRRRGRYRRWRDHGFERMGFGGGAGVWVGLLSHHSCYC